MNELFHAMSGGTPRSFFDPLWREARIFPLLNVKELDESYVVTAEIPGMKTEDLDIKVIGDTLTLKGERKPMEIGEGASYHRRERATGTFQRSLTLPGRVEPDGVKANYKNGILTVTLQKEAIAQPKQISITAE
jgi:HSP20 family protein